MTFRALPRATRASPHGAECVPVDDPQDHRRAGRGPNSTVTSNPSIGRSAIDPERVPFRLSLSDVQYPVVLLCNANCIS